MHKYALGSVAYDACWSERWHLQFIQAVNDPLWQTKQEPCAHTGLWLQEAYPCEGGADTYKYPPQVEPKIVTPAHLTSVGVSWDDWKPTAGPALLGVSGNCNGQPDTDPPWNKEPHSIRLAWEGCADWINFTARYCP